MIKFFRKIRRNLLSENKFRKYLIYAIGEIILVVIGILNALQINNWNEQRKESNLELEMLIGLSDDLANNKLKILNMISSDSLIIVGNQNLLSLLKDNGSIYNDSLQISFGRINRYSFFSLREWCTNHSNQKGFKS